jgi:Ca2+-binding EF-hand superfamily protein
MTTSSSIILDLAFVTAMSRKVTPQTPQAKLLAAFRLFDEAGYDTPSGRIRTEDVFSIMEGLGTVERRMKHDDVEDLLSGLAPQALESGFLDYVNFVNMIFTS